MSRSYLRWQRDTLEKALKTCRVLLLCGARQCGKTTLAKELVSQHIAYRTLDDPAVRQIAETDPRGFVKHAEKTLIIDEIQRAPDLLSAIKINVDKNTRPGQYLLTGSADIQSSPGVRESLAGRIRKVRLRPLTRGEILGVSPDFLERAFRQDFGHPDRAYDRDAMLDISFGGGFPEAVLLGDTERRLWHRDYVDALVERDLRDLGRIQRRDALSELIHALAAWSGKFMDISSIGAGLSINRSTVETYINALEALYMVERVRAWNRTDYARARDVLSSLQIVHRSSRFTRIFFYVTQTTCKLPLVIRGQIVYNAQPETLQVRSQKEISANRMILRKSLPRKMCATCLLTTLRKRLYT